MRSIDTEEAKKLKESYRQNCRSLVLQVRDRYKRELIAFAYGREAESLVHAEHAEFSMLDTRLRKSLVTIRSKRGFGSRYNNRGQRHHPYNN